MKIFVKIAFCLFLLFSVVFSFKRYYYFTLEGDLPAIVLPDSGFYQTVMDDPFGLNVILHDSVYPATNRFFTHLEIEWCFKTLPFCFQKLSTPVKSIYYSCALVKTGVQFFLIFLMAFVITGSRKFFGFDFLFVGVLLIPFFQTFGFNQWMGIIDHSITYTFFYALSLGLVMAFFLPFFYNWFHKGSLKINYLTFILLICLLVIISFNGPLNPPLILLIGLTIIFNFFSGIFFSFNAISIFEKIKISLKSIPLNLFLLIFLACLMSGYSFYIGLNNSENLWEKISLGERYSRLPSGLWNQYLSVPGPVLLITILILNVFIIYFLKDDLKKKKIFFLLKWFAILCLIYILLLPLGGYRSYRPDIIRRDTILPVTLGLLFFYGLTAFYIIKTVSVKYKKPYYSLIFIVGLIFFVHDFELRKYNLCERNAFEKISQSPDRVVFLDNDCSVMNWGKTLDTANSENKTKVLLYWGVIKEKKLYYQK